MCTGAWKHTEYFVSISASSIDEFNNALSVNSFQGMNLINGSLLTSFAFKSGLSWIFNYGDKIITLSVLLFATSTAISWSFYGDRATEYLFGSSYITYYRYVYVMMVFFGSLLTLKQVWNLGDAALAFMTFPNLIAIILLSTKLKDISSKYFEKY